MKNRIYRFNLGARNFVLFGFSSETNYFFLICDKINSVAMAIDPGNSEDEIIDVCNNYNMKLSVITHTHCHQDHVGNSITLAKKSGAKILNSPKNARLIKGTNGILPAIFRIGNLRIVSFEARCHVSGHVLFYIPELKIMFSGDVIFASGCGRAFDGDEYGLFNACCFIKSFDPELLIFCGHDYSEYNIGFALSLMPNRESFRKREKQIKDSKLSDKPFCPLLLRDELMTNPFLLTHDYDLRNALGFTNDSERDFFVHLRRMRNNW